MRVEDNEKLVRVGPGTPAGNLFRRYWIPALLSEELPEPDGAPARVRLLGEDLIAFRDSAGHVGLVEAYCPHRRAPMFFGRNEESGLRCVYHGWKFNRDGQCVDMPSEPAGSPLQARVRIKSYPTHEAGNVVWTYMGPAELQPAPPDIEWLRAPPTHRHVSKTFEACNYLQALEGGLDTAHSSFVHNNNIQNKNDVRTRDRAPRIELERTDYGYYYLSRRSMDDNREWVRVYHYVMPNIQFRPGVTAIDGSREQVAKIDGHVWVPIDDETSFVYNWAYAYDGFHPLPHDFMEGWEQFAGRGKQNVIPGTYKLLRNPSNDYLIDRQLQKTRTFTGITGLNTQDFALQEGMGPVVDRSKEFLGTSDRAIVALRRMLLEAIDTVAHGQSPPGLIGRSCQNIRAYDAFVEKGRDWREAFGDEIHAKW